MNEFLNDPGFDKKTYDQYISRIHYDNRDAANYENMLQFLWGYITRQDGPEDRNGLLEEYTHWNAQLMTKCYYHMPHDLPYANLRRAYQSVVLLLLGEWEEGLEELDLSNDLVVLLEEPDLSNERDGVDWVLLGVLKLLFDEEPPVLPNERDGLVVLLLAPGVLRVLLWRVVPDMLFCVRFSLLRAFPMLVAPVLGVALMLRLPRVVSKLRLLPTPLPLPLPWLPLPKPLPWFPFPWLPWFPLS